MELEFRNDTETSINIHAEGRKYTIPPDGTKTIKSPKNKELTIDDDVSIFMYEIPFGPRPNTASPYLSDQCSLVVHVKSIKELHIIPISGTPTNETMVLHGKKKK